MGSPRDRFVTVYGRQAVLEALTDAELMVDKVLVADNARGANVDQILAAARRRGLAVQRVAPHQVTRLSRNGRQDQGVVADVVAPGMRGLHDALVAGDLDGPLLLLDGVTNPQNVGMIIRTATAAGVAGIVLPRTGVPDVGPLVLKASAGVAFRAPLLRCATAAEAAAALTGPGGYRLHGLAAAADRSLFDDRPFAARAAFVLGSESDGVSGDVAAHVHEWVGIPLARGVDSLNVAVAAGVVCFELLRRRW